MSARILFMKLKYVKYILFEKRQQNDAAYMQLWWKIIRIFSKEHYEALYEGGKKRTNNNNKIYIDGMRRFLIPVKIRKINLHF